MHFAELIRRRGFSIHSGSREMIQQLERRQLLTSIVVNSMTDAATANDGQISLRAAIAMANTSTTPTDITFSPDFFYAPFTLKLTNGVLELTNTAEATTITGSNAGINISGNNSTGVFKIDTSVIASLTNLTITGGTGSAGGTLYANEGGGIFNAGNITVTDVTISGNSASAGGGFANDGNAPQFGFFPNQGTATLIDDTISGNTATGSGGGILNANNSGLTVINCTIYGNTVTGSTGVGGGLATQNGGSAKLINTTISGNSASGFSSENQPENAGGGVYDAFSSLSLGNTIVAGNTTKSLEPDIGAFSTQSVISLGHNFVGSGAGGAFTANTSDKVGTAASPPNPMLGALSLISNPFPTQTLAPLTGSPVINAGSNALVPASVSTDQRGVPRIAQGTVDIGAVEVQAVSSPLVVNTFFDYSTVINGLTSLRAAIILADTNTVPTTITFDPKVFAVVDILVLSNGYVELTNTAEPTTITGPSVGLLLDGAVFVANRLEQDLVGGLLAVDAGVKASISKLSFTQGIGYVPRTSPNLPNFLGGGVFNAGNLTLTDLDVASDNASTGGGIYNSGTIDLSNDTISGNNGDEAGGLYNDTGATATLNNDIITGNTNGGRASIGGGIWNLGNISITNTTVSSNTGGTGAAIDNQGTASLTDVAITGNTGTNGGIANSGTLSLTNVTVAGNNAGALLNSGGTARLLDVTLSANTGFAGGPPPFGSAVEAGIEITAGTVTVGNTIDAANTVTVSGEGVSTTTESDIEVSTGARLVSLGHNFIGEIDNVTGWLSSDLTGTVAAPLNPQLSTLANNGGPTKTLLPVTTGPVVNAGSNALVPAGITTDQRGLPRISGTSVDIGAVEVQQAIQPPVQLTGFPIGTLATWDGTGTVQKAFDGNLNTFFDPANASLTNWVGLDLGVNATLTQISFAPRADFASRMLNGTFQVSSTPDFSANVKTIYTITSVPKAGLLTTVSVSPGAAYRYVRYTGGTQWVNIAEMKVFGVETTPPPAISTFTGTAIGVGGSWNANSTYAKAIDGNLSTYFDPANSNLSNWVGIDLGSAKTISQISFAPRASYEFRMIGGQFQVSSSASFSSDVHTIYTITEKPGDSLTTVSFEPAGAYRYIRYTGGSQWVNIAEMKVAGPSNAIPGSAIASQTGQIFSSGSGTITALDNDLDSYFGGSRRW